MRHEQLERHDLRGQGHDPAGGAQRGGQFFAMVDSDEAWEAPTGAGHWQVRDVVGHIVDTTEAYFVGVRRGPRRDRDACGVWACRGWRRGWTSRPRHCAACRVRSWWSGCGPTSTNDGDPRGARRGGLGRPDRVALLHGPLPAFFYPAFQLMDYGVHSWDIRQGTGRAHGLSGEAADLLVPFMFVLWKYTAGALGPQPVRARHPDHQRAERRRHPRHRGSRRAWTTRQAT